MGKKCDDNSCSEAKNAQHLSRHSPILNCDHLTEMLTATINDSNIISHLQMRRSKCSEKKNVQGPYFHSVLVKDIGVGNH